MNSHKFPRNPTKSTSSFTELRENHGKPISQDASGLGAEEVIGSWRDPEVEGFFSFHKMETYGKTMENHGKPFNFPHFRWKTMGKRSENMKNMGRTGWKTMGKTVDNQGKPMENYGQLVKRWETRWKTQLKIGWHFTKHYGKQNWNYGWVTTPYRIYRYLSWNQVLDVIFT